MGFSPDCRDLSIGMVVGPQLFGIFPGGSHLLDVGSSGSQVRSTLGGIWRAVGDYAADESGPRGPFPVSFVLLAQHRRRVHLPWVRQGVAAILFFVLILIPWTARNYLAFGKLVPIKDNFGLELWLGNNPDVKRSMTPDHHPVGNPPEMQKLLLLGEAKYMQVKQREAVEFIETHPRFFLKSVLDRFVDTWTGTGDVPSDRWVGALRAGTAYIWLTSTLSLLSFAGLFLAWRSFGWEAAPIWIAPILFPITYYLTHSVLRYRHPIDPVLTVLAVCALARARSFVLRRNLAQAPSSTLQVN